MIKSGIQYHVNHKLHGNVKLILPQVDSTVGCTLSRFIMLKSSTLVGFSALPWQSGNVIALHRDNVVSRRCGSTAPSALCAGAPGYIRAGKLEAASWEQAEAA